MRVYRLFSISVDENGVVESKIRYEKYDYYYDSSGNIEQLNRNGFYYKSVQGANNTGKKAHIIQAIIFNIDHDFASVTNLTKLTNLTEYKEMIISDLRDEKIGGLLNEII